MVGLCLVLSHIEQAGEGIWSPEEAVGEGRDGRRHSFKRHHHHRQQEAEEGEEIVLN